MANEDRRATDPSQRAFYCRDVARECVQAILSGDHLVPFRLKRWNHFVKTRAVGSDPVTEDDARFGLRRFHFALLGCLSRTAASTEPGSTSRKILPEAKDQAAERHAERAVDRLGLQRRIIGQNLNRDVGVANRNDTGVLHAEDSHIDLSLSEATRRVDDRITLEAVGKGSYGRERETHISGNACDDD